MRTGFWKFIACVGVAALGFAVMPLASAECGLPNKPIRWHPQLNGVTPWLVRAAFDRYDDDNQDPIVGMWHVIFTAQTQNGVDIPVAGGVVIDNAVAAWHSDGTEIMNSSRSAQDGNFCLGVWKSTGRHTYLLNHIPWQGNIFDPTVPQGTIGAPQGGAQILQNITLSRDGNSYTGTFTLNAYDVAGNVYVSFTGVLSATRITPDTPFSSLL